MYDIIPANLVLLAIVSFLELWLIIKSTFTGIERITGLFVVGSTFIYSGVTLIYKSAGREYFFQYVVFTIVLTLTMSIVFSTKNSIAGRSVLLLKKAAVITVRNEERTQNSQAYITCERKSVTATIPDWFLFLMYVLMNTYYVVTVFSQGRGLRGFFDISLSLVGIFARQNALRANALTNLFRMINIFALPWAYIFIQRVKKRGKIILTVLLLIIPVYLYIASLGYIGRNQLVQDFLLVMLVLFNNRSNEYKLSFKIIAFFIILFVASMPLMLAYESLRLGATASNTSFLDAATQLLHKETDFGKYYSYCLQIHKGNLWYRYLYWFITLPLPSVIAGPLKSNIFTVNTYFSELFLGVSSTASNYYVVLPSFLGEAFVIYGADFYWIHAIFVGFVTAFACVCLERNKELAMYNLYIAVSTIMIGRAGFASYAGTLINSMFFYLIFMYIYKCLVTVR